VSQVCFRLASGARGVFGATVLARQFRLFQVVFLMVALAAGAVAPLVIRVAFGAEFLPAIATARWLIAAMLLWSCSQLLENGMRGLGLAGACAASNLAALVLAAVCSPWLIREQGIMGMGIAMCLGQAVSLVLKGLLLARWAKLGFLHFWGLRPEVTVEVARLVRNSRALPGLRAMARGWYMQWRGSWS